MWYLEDLGDYHLLDCSDGERLERWGKYTLIRPDPQVVWKGLHRHPDWKKADAVYTRSRSGGGNWNDHKLPPSWKCNIAGLSFHVKPMGFKHTGVFPEQASNWKWMEDLCKKRREEGKEVRVLNLFAYTGGASLASAKGGAHVAHVDAAKNMVAMAKENMKLSGMESASCRYLVDDALKFVQREARRGNRYDGIVMDPPSYGRGPKGEMWHLEDSIHDLIRETAAILSDDPLFYLVNSYTTGLSGSAVSYLVNEEVKSRFGGTISSDEVGLMVESTGKCLPCGFATRWEKE
ncbi:MAG: class I SAM-dependent methyltransferase [Clostridia bacterium]|nr:class I SAM-dependent methyltransferase [Clostridia bacterium]